MREIWVACALVVASCARPVEKRDDVPKETRAATKESAAPSASSPSPARPVACDYVATLGLKAIEWAEFTPGKFACLSPPAKFGRSLVLYRVEGDAMGPTRLTVAFNRFDGDDVKAATDLFTNAIVAILEREAIPLPTGETGVGKAIATGKPSRWKVGDKTLTFDGERFSSGKGQRIEFTVTLRGDSPTLKTATP